MFVIICLYVFVQDIIFWYAKKSIKCNWTLYLDFGGGDSSLCSPLLKTLSNDCCRTSLKFYFLLFTVKFCNTFLLLAAAVYVQKKDIVRKCYYSSRRVTMYWRLSHTKCHEDRKIFASCTLWSQDYIDRKAV